MKCLSYIKLQTIKHTEAATKLFMVASCDQKLFGLQYISYFLILFSKSTAPPTRAPVAPPTDATAAVAVADKPAAPENKDRRQKKKKNNNNNNTPYNSNNRTRMTQRTEACFIK